MIALMALRLAQPAPIPQTINQTLTQADERYGGHDDRDQAYLAAQGALLGTIAQIER
jgi:hypothetical protein